MMLVPGRQRQAGHQLARTETTQQAGSACRLKRIVADVCSCNWSACGELEAAGPASTVLQGQIQLKLQSIGHHPACATLRTPGQRAAAGAWQACQHLLVCYGALSLLLLWLLQAAALPQLHLAFGALPRLQRLLWRKYFAGSVEQRLPLLLDSIWLRLLCLLLVICTGILLLLYTPILLLLLTLPQPATYAALAITGSCTPEVATTTGVLMSCSCCYVASMRLHRL
jgi:hypothetical protein